MEPSYPPPPDWSEAVPTSSWSAIPNPLPTHNEPWIPPGEPGPDRRGTYVGFKLPRWRRLVAEVIDYAVPIFLFYGAPDFLGLAGMAFVFANSGVYQGLTGQSLGKRVMGLKLAYGVIWPNTNRVTFCYPGVLRTLGRLFLNACGALMLATIWPPLAFLLLGGVLLGRYRRSWGDWCMKLLVLPPSAPQLVDKEGGQIASMRAKNTTPS
jgi:hypothetical protein